MPTLLILTAGFGEGHNAAARNLAAGLHRLAGDALRVEVADLVLETYGPLARLAQSAYRTTINRAPRVWELFYNFLDQPGHEPMHFPGARGLIERLRSRIRRLHPVAVVTTYPVYNHFLADLFPSRPPFPHFTIVTDSVSIHAVWTRAPSDWFIVPNPLTAAVLASRSIPSDRILPLGFPVPLEFAEPPPAALPSPGLPHVLFVVNASHSAEPVVQRLLDIPRLRLTVATGRNVSLRTRIQAIAEPHADRATVLGWCNNMPRLLQTHHLLIGKAGGATTQEAIAACCPMIVQQIVPGQEAGNFDTLRHAGGAVFADTPERIAQSVDDIFARGASRWSAMREGLRSIARPHASLEIAAFLLDKIRVSPKKFG